MSSIQLHWGNESAYFPLLKMLSYGARWLRILNDGVQIEAQKECSDYVKIISSHHPAEKVRIIGMIHRSCLIFDPP